MRFFVFIIIISFLLSCEKEKEKKQVSENKNPRTSFSIRNNTNYLLSPVACVRDSSIEIEVLEPLETSRVNYVQDTVIYIQYQILDKHVIIDSPYFIPSLKHTVITITDDYNPFSETL